MEKDLQGEIDAAVAKEFPIPKQQYRKDRELEAEQRFKMVKYGEKITIISPRFKKFTGTYYGYSHSSKSILVNSRTIPLIDLSPVTIGQIDQNVNIRQKKEFIQNSCYSYSREISEFKIRTKKELMEKKGYIFVFDKFYSPEEYIDLLNKIYNPSENKTETNQNQPVKEKTIEEELNEEISQ